MIGTILQTAGSLALFLYGMKVMSDGIQKAAGERLHRILGLMTVNRFAGVLTGVAITAIVQSSSATTVMVVSFVNAGLLPLTQSIGIIMGANIGTTVTGWIVALLGFKVKLYVVSLPAIGVGMVLLLAKRLGKRDWGEAIIGFGLLFLGLKFLKDSVPDIGSNPEALAFLRGLAGRGLLSFAAFVAAGTALTIIVQSSSAAMAITLTMAYLGWVDFATAAALVLGENIGTTITANLASINTSVDARRAARLHLLFNVCGVVWMAILYPYFIRLVDFIVPGAIEGKDGITAHLAMFHTLFNVANTLIFVGFARHLGLLAEKLVKDRKGEVRGAYHLKYVSTAIQETPEINLVKAQREIHKMAGVVEDMFQTFLRIFENPKKKMGDVVAAIKETEEYTDQMREQISLFLVNCMRENLNETAANNVNVMVRVIDELESIGDGCLNLVLLAARRYDKKIRLPQKAVEEIAPYTTLVQEFLAFNREHLEDHLSARDLQKAYELEDKINRYRNLLKKQAQKRLKRGANVRAEILYIDILRQIERLGDYCLNLSKAMTEFNRTPASGRSDLKPGSKRAARPR